MARPKWLFRFSSRTSGDIGRDVADEIAFHLEARVQELIDRGWTPAAARREASRRFGDIATTADYCRRLDEDRERGMRIREWFDDLWQDTVYALRLLYRQPGLSAVALLTIAIGIAATTVVFSVVYTALLSPLPYANADRLIVVRASLPDYADLRASANVFEDSGSYASNQYMLDDEQVLGGVVTPGFFRTLGSHRFSDASSKRTTGRRLSSSSATACGGAGSAAIRTSSAGRSRCPARATRFSA